MRLSTLGLLLAKMSEAATEETRRRPGHDINPIFFGLSRVFEAGAEECLRIALEEQTDD